MSDTPHSQVNLKENTSLKSKKTHNSISLKEADIITMSSNKHSISTKKKKVGIGVYLSEYNRPSALA